MSYAVFIKNPHTGDHYQRTIWYKENRRADVESALESWSEIEGTDAFIVEDKNQEGE